MIHGPTMLPSQDEERDLAGAHPFAPEHTRVIYNPTSGTAVTKARARRLLALLRHRGYRIESTDELEKWPVHARDALLAELEAVIIIGGDGTLYGTIARLPAHVRIAYFPGGTMNLFALNWHIPRSPEKWIELLDAGLTQRVRLGLCNDRPFASVASVGFDAMVVHRTRYPLKKILSHGAYALEFLPSYLAYNAPRFRITIDGEPGPEDVLGIIIGRGRHYGGPFRVLQNSDPHRPELAYAILGGKDKWLLGKFAVGVLFETLAAMHGASCGRASEITVDADPPTYVQLDGDAYGSTPVRFVVEDNERTLLA